MNCDQIREQFSALIDGEIGAAEAQVIHDHLVSCDECRHEHAALVDLGTFTKAWFRREAEETAPARTIDPAVAVRTFLAARRRAWWGTFARRATPIAAGLLLVLGLFHFLPLTEPQASAATLKEAAARTLGDHTWLKIDLRPRGYDKLPPNLRAEAHLVVGPHGELLMQTSILLPPLPGSTRFTLPLLPANKTGWMGSDGKTAWRWVEGDKDVQVADLAGETLLGANRGGHGRGPLATDQNPGALVDWGHAQDMLEFMRSGEFDFRELRQETVDAEAMTVFEVKSAAGPRRPAMRAEVWVDGNGTVRQVIVSGMVARIRRLDPAPDPATFGWESHATGANPVKVR